MKVPAGKSANVPLTLVVPSNAVSGQDHVILTAGRVHFDVRFSVGVSAPRPCLAAGYGPRPANHSTALLWLIGLLLVVAVVLWARRKSPRKG